MIKEIKIYKIKVKNGALNRKEYSPVDITKQVIMQINDSGQYDSILDSSQLTLLTNSREPIRPFTKIIIRITDDNEDVENIYRYVSKDTVVNCAKGNNPIYKHVLTLVEATKRLEREACDNLSFTNYLSENYGTENEVVYKVAETYTHATNNELYNQSFSYSYANANRLLGPYRVLHEDTSLNIINMNWLLNVKSTQNKSWLASIFKQFNTEKCGLIDITVVDPDGNSTSVAHGGNFNYTKQGIHKIYHTYEYRSANSYFVYRIKFVWQLYIVASKDYVPQEYTIYDVVQKLLSTYKLTRQSERSPYSINQGLEKKLDIKLSPEFDLPQKTLYEALQQVGYYIHAKPRLLPNPIVRKNKDKDGNEYEYIDDWTDWSVVSFDFYGAPSKNIKNPPTVIDENNHSADDYATDYVSYLQNATHTNYSATATVVDPFIGGYISTRTESELFEISDKECIIKTNKPIRSVISLSVYSGGEVIDITDRIVEETKYNLKSAYTTTDSYNNKACFLYYTRGERHIRGLTYKRDHQSVFSTEGSIYPAIRNIIQLYCGKNCESKFKNLCFQIKYIPYQNIKIRAFKPNLSDKSEHLSLYYNQTADVVDVDAYGENIRGMQIATGNANMISTIFANNLKGVPKPGDRFNEFYAYKVDRDMRVGAPIKATIQWSKNYNQISSDINIKRDVRETEIATESQNRNSDYTEFCIISTELDLDYYISSWNSAGLDEAEYKAFIASELSGLGIATTNMLQLMKTKFQNYETKDCGLSFAIIRTNFTNSAGDEENKTFLLPTSCFPFGNSMIIHFAMDDNYSANTTSSNAEDDDDYNLEEYIPHVNSYGRFSTMQVLLGNKNPLLDYEKDIKSNSKLLYEIDPAKINFDATIINYWDDGFNVDKDNKTTFGLTLQLPFVTYKDNITIGPAMPATLPFVGDETTKYKFVVFTKLPNKFDAVVDPKYYGECDYPEVAVDEDFKYIKFSSTTACKSGVGYGIITNDNKLLVCVEQNLFKGDETKPLYLMFRKEI